jgi:O-antigen ligase
MSTESLHTSTFSSSNVRRKGLIAKPKAGLTVTTTILFLIIAAYIVIPVLEVPLMGLSLSAPIFFFVAIEIFFRPPEPWFGEYRLWIGLAAAIWLGIALSLLGSSLFHYGDNLSPGLTTTSLIMLVRYSYWLLILVGTTYVVSYARLGNRVVHIFAVMIVILAIMRWTELILFNATGANPSNLHFLTQNSYGILFSTFTAMLLLPLLVGGWKWRMLAIAGLPIIFGAIVLNTSRGAWIAVSLSGIVLLLLFMVAKPSRSGNLMWLIIPLLFFQLLLWVAPLQIFEGVNEHFVSLEELETDKSFAVRQLMIQKAQRIFEESPIFGVGVGNFTRSTVDLDLPDILRYLPEANFNSRSAHNSYIAFLSETGLLGTVPYGLLMLVLITAGLRAAIRLARRDQYWGLGVYAAFIGMSIHFWVISAMTGTHTWFVYGLVAAMIMTDWQQHNRV